MKALSINTIDVIGGAAKVAYLLKQGLTQFDIHTKMFVKYKKSDDDDVSEMPDYTVLNKIGDVLKHYTGRDLITFLKSKAILITANDLEFFKPTSIIKTQAYQQAEIIHCHNLHGNYFNIHLLKQMSYEKPLIWTLHDMWALTSHCAHTPLKVDSKSGFYPCRNLNEYQTLTWDNSRYLQYRKGSVYKQTPLTVVAPCKWLKQKVSQSVLGGHKIELIYNGINHHVFKSTEVKQARKELNLPQNKFIVMFLAYGGKHNNVKGWNYTQEAIDAFKDKTDVKFLCIGGKPEDAKNNNRYITYIPQINQPELLSKYFSACDLFLFTSVQETFPLVVLESLSCKTPVVSFDVGGVKEAVIHKKNGYIAQLKSTNELIEGINWYLNLNTNQRSIIGNNARDGIKRQFTLDQMLKKYADLYADSVKNF